MGLLDWNGNGKIDPVDIGISIGAAPDDGDEPPEEPAPGGCLPCVLLVLLTVSAVLVTNIFT